MAFEGSAHFESVQTCEADNWLERIELEIFLSETEWAAYKEQNLDFYILKTWELLAEKSVQ